MSKRMPKTLLSLMEEAQKQIIAETLYFTGDTLSFKEEVKRTAHRGLEIWEITPKQGQKKACLIIILFSQPHAERYLTK